MVQRWSRLLFAHYPVAKEVVRALLPSGLPIDTFDDSAWLTITPFHLSHLRFRGLPTLPGFSEFPELNVRTYVVLDGKPGVYFFSLDAGRAFAVWGARAFYHLPYFHAAMTLREKAGGAIEYHCRRIDARAGAAELIAEYRSTGEATMSEPGSPDHWLTERYCLYAADRHRRVYRADIHHRPWSLRPAELEIRRNTMADAAGIPIPPRAERLAFSDSLDVLVWRPKRVSM